MNKAVKQLNPHVYVLKY